MVWFGLVFDNEILFPKNQHNKVSGQILQLAQKMFNAHILSLAAVVVVCVFSILSIAFISMRPDISRVIIFIEIHLKRYHIKKHRSVA